MENKAFPESLEDIGFSERIELSNGDHVLWMYKVFESKKKCQLITSDKIEGYFVILNENGNIIISASVPKFNILWTIEK